MPDARKQVPSSGTTAKRRKGRPPKDPGGTPAAQAREVSAFELSWQVLKALAAGADGTATIREHLQAVLPEFALPVDSTIWKHLQHLVDCHLVKKVQTGRADRYELNYREIGPWLSPRERDDLVSAIAILEDFGLGHVVPIGELAKRAGLTSRSAGLVIRTSRGVRPGGQSPHYETIVKAIRSRQQLRITYQSPVAVAPGDYVLDAKELFWDSGSLYLRAWCPNSPGELPWQKNREFRVELIQAVEPLSTRNLQDRLPDFTYAFWAAPVFAPRFQRAIEALNPRDPQTQTIPGQQVSPDPTVPGAMIITARAPGMLQAVKRLLAFGQHVRVLEPPELVAEMAETIRQMAARYQEA